MLKPLPFLPTSPAELAIMMGKPKIPRVKLIFNDLFSGIVNDILSNNLRYGIMNVRRLGLIRFVPKIIIQNSRSQIWTRL